MARARHDDDARAGDPLTEEPRVLGRREPILLATDREGRSANGVDPGHHVEGVARSQIPRTTPSGLAAIAWSSDALSAVGAVGLTAIRISRLTPSGSSVANSSSSRGRTRRRAPVPTRIRPSTRSGYVSANS